MVSILLVVVKWMGTNTSFLPRTNTNNIKNIKNIKKLTLSKKKCHIVHIGKEKAGGCSSLKINNSSMNKETNVKYLGDHINETGTIKSTVDERRSRAFGISAEILSITNSVPLGPWRVRSGILLRQAMLVNGSLYNSECWQGKSVDREVSTLDKPDQALLRALVLAHSKAPIEFLFLETGCIPLSLIHICRRVIYLHTILTKDPSELVRRTYDAQKTDSLPGDFCRLIEADFQKLEISLSENQISSMTSNAYKKYIKSKVSKYAFESLTTEQQSHSKIKHIKYTKLEMQPHLKSPLFHKINI